MTTTPNSTSLEDQLKLCDEYADSKEFRNIYVAVFCLILLIAVVANGTVLFIIYARRLWRDTSVLMIGNLAISDILVCIAVLVPEISKWIDLWVDYTYSSLHVCRIHVVAEALFPTVTIFSLVVMSFERCRLSRSKVIHIRNTLTRCYVTLLAVWGLALATSLPVIRVCHGFRDIFFFVDDSGDFMTIFLLFRFIFVYVFPLVLISLFYCTMAVTLCGCTKTSERATSKRLRTNKAGKLAHERRQRLAVMVLLLVAVFAIGWLPYYLFRFLFYSVDPVILCTSIVLVHLKNFRLIFFCLLSLLNPFIVYVVGDNFRRYLHDLVKCRGDRNYMMTSTRRAERGPTQALGTTMSFLTNVSSHAFIVEDKPSE